MPNYVIVQVDPLPVAGAPAKAGSIALVTAADIGPAMDAFSVMTGSITPIVAQIALATAFTKYTNTSIVQRTSTPG